MKKLLIFNFFVFAVICLTNILLNHSAYGAVGDVIKTIDLCSKIPNCQQLDDIGFDGIFIFTEYENNIYKFDTSGNLVDTILWNRGGITGWAFDGANFWVASSGNVNPAFKGTIYKINISPWSIQKFIDWPHYHPYGIAWDGSKLWVVGNDTQGLYTVDILSGLITRKFNPPGSKPVGLAIDGNKLWMSDYKNDSGSVSYLDDKIYIIDMQTGSVINHFTPPSGKSRGIAYNFKDDTLLYTGSTKLLYVLDSGNTSGSAKGNITIVSLNPGSFPLYTIIPANINEPFVFAGYIKDENGLPIANESFDIEDPVSKVSIVNGLMTNSEGFFIFKTHDNNGFSYVNQWSGNPGLYTFVVYKASYIVGNIIVPVNPKPGMLESDFSAITDFNISGVINRPLSSYESAWVHKIENSKIPKPDISAKKEMTRKVIDALTTTQISAFNEWASSINIFLLSGLGATCIIFPATCPAFASFIISSVLVAEAAEFTDQLHMTGLLNSKNHDDLRKILEVGSDLISVAYMNSDIEAILAGISLFEIGVNNLADVSVRRNEVIGTKYSIAVLEITDKNEKVHQLSFSRKKKSVDPSYLIPLILSD